MHGRRHASFHSRLMLDTRSIACIFVHSSRLLRHSSHTSLTLSIILTHYTGMPHYAQGGPDLNKGSQGTELSRLRLIHNCLG